MNGPDFKICGLTSATAIDAALSGGANHVGFIFFPKSPRNIDAAAAGALAGAARGKAKIVAVTVDAADAEIDAIVSKLRPDLLQLHGRETPERVVAVKARYALPVMKAFAIRTASDLAAVDAYRGTADRLLFDAKAPAGSKLPGGNGISFDWTALSALDRSVDYMLSGGLDKDNIGAAMATTKASGFDVSSGVESAPGVKDEAMIAAFFEAVRRAATAYETQGAER